MSLFKRNKKITPETTVTVNPDDLYDIPIPTITKYIIKPGDTFTKIAQNNGISVDYLKELNPSISNLNKIRIGQELTIPFELQDPEDIIAYKTHEVKNGESLSSIAKKYGLSLLDLLDINDLANPNIIHTGDKINIEAVKSAKQPQYVNIKDLRKEEEEYNKSNLTAIQAAKHEGNYVVIDKNNNILTIYNKQNKPIYSTKDIATGLSGNDYNTITYVDSKGNIINNAGNNSTPAGITKIYASGEYHGYPSFTRVRVDDNDNIATTTTKDKNGNIQIIPDTVASSIHFGNTINSKSSNGCIRAGGKTLCSLQPYLKRNTPVYTLPEKEGSRFVLRDGNLSFVADNPYGESEGQYRNWDDYNVVINKTYQPIGIEFGDQANQQNNRWKFNARTYADQIQNDKERMMKDFNLDSATYNSLAMLAMGIAEQESKYGTSNKKVAKDIIGNDLVTTLKQIKHGVELNGIYNSNAGTLNITSILPNLINAYKTGKEDSSFNPANSRGYTQIKLTGDNKELQDVYKKYNITPDNIDISPNNSATATMLRLIHMYNNEVKGKTFTDRNGNPLDNMDVLLYKWMGKNSELNNQTATPNINKYIRNVKDYSDMFNYWTVR